MLANMHVSYEMLHVTHRVICVVFVQAALLLQDATLMRGESLRMLRPCEMFVKRVEAIEGPDVPIALGMISDNGKTNKVC
jgi:hypothetical protein